jgi:hypothetical protein
MKKKIISLLHISVFLFIISCQQEDPKKKQLQSALEEIDRVKGEYNQNYLQDSTGFLVIKHVYTNGNYVSDSLVALKRNGTFPYRNEKKATLPFVVSYYTAANELVGMYSMENPATSRTCEEGKEEIRFNEGLVFEILIPNNPAIRRYTISVNGKEVSTQTLPKRILKEGDGNRDVKDSSNIR